MATSDRRGAGDGRGGGFLLSARNLVGCVGAAVTAAAGAAALLANVVPGGALGAGAVALAAAGAYGLGVALTPGPRAQPGTGPGQREWTVEELGDRLDRVRRRAPGLPCEVSGPLIEATDDLRQLLDRWDVVRQATETAYEVEVAITDYLPGALDAYECIPVDLREKSRGTRPTPTNSLVRQLGTLGEHLQQLRDAAYEQDIAALESHERFITTKYARSSLDL